MESLKVEKQDSQDGVSANADAGSHGGRSSNEGEFNFKRELKEFKDLVKETKLTNVQEGVKADLAVQILEGTCFQIAWSVAEGMKITA